MSEQFDPLSESSVFKFWLNRLNLQDRVNQAQTLVQQLHKAMLANDSSEAKTLTNQLATYFNPDCESSIKDAYVLSQGFLLCGQLAQAETFISFGLEIHSRNKNKDRTEGVLLAFTQARITEAKGHIIEACGQLSELINGCVTSGDVDLLHALVITQCVYYNKIGEISEIFETLQKTLPLIRDHDKEYRDVLRVFWKSIKSKQNLAENENEIIRLILNNDVQDHIAIRNPPSLPIEFQPDWGCDGISHFLSEADNNTVSTFVNQKYEFETLIHLDARFSVSIEKAIEVVLANVIDREGENISLESISNPDFAEIFFLMSAHSALLGACRLATSSQFAETHMLLRALLENALYCFGIRNHRKWRQIWFERHQDSDSYERCKKAFVVTTILSKMESQDLNLSKECDYFYNKLIDLGAHPNTKVFEAIASAKRENDSITFAVNVLSPDRLNELLDIVVDVALLALEVFSLAMPNCIAAPPKPQSDKNSISQRAFERWCNRGHEHGKDLHDWFRALADLRCRI